MRPRFVINADGVWVVKWVGILTDWELSRPMVTSTSEHQTRQPRRMVSHLLFLLMENMQATSPFMSVASLENPYSEITVADDIESFFNILLYQAVRRVSHNFDGDTVTTIVADYLLPQTTAQRRVRNVRIYQKNNDGEGQRTASHKHALCPLLFPSLQCTQHGPRCALHIHASLVLGTIPCSRL